jgi:hypothetical protein
MVDLLTRSGWPFSTFLAARRSCSTLPPAFPGTTPRPETIAVNAMPCTIAVNATPPTSGAHNVDAVEFTGEGQRGMARRGHQIQRYGIGTG